MGTTKKPTPAPTEKKNDPKLMKNILELTTDELLTLLNVKVKKDSDALLSMADCFDGIVLRNITVRELIVSLLAVADLDTPVHRLPTDQYDPGVSTVISKNEDGSVRIDIADMMDSDSNDDDCCDNCDADCGACPSCCGSEEEEADDDQPDESCGDQSSCMFGFTGFDRVADYFESVFGSSMICMHSYHCENKNCRYHSENPNRK